MIASGIAGFYLLSDFNATDQVFGVTTPVYVEIVTGITALSTTSNVQCTLYGDDSTNISLSGPADTDDYAASWLMTAAPQTGGNIYAYLATIPTNVNVSTPLELNKTFYIAWNILSL